MIEKTKSTSFAIMSLLIFSVISPVYSEVIDFSTNTNQYDAKNDEIGFSGLVDNNSDVLVTIVIRDKNDEFVLLTQSLIQSDNTYEKIVKIDKKFSTDGMYNATAFITNITLGKIANFEYAHDGFQDAVVPTTSKINVEPIKTIQEIEEQPIENIPDTKNKTPSFVDPNKDPREYVDRYYNEKIYREWFDKNFPNITIEEVVGYVPDEIIVEQDVNNRNIIAPTANAVLMNPKISVNDELKGNELAQMILAVGGIVVLLGAVYGVRSKFDGKININTKKPGLMKKKLFSPIMGQEPLDVIKNRLAKGEISVEEYASIRTALKNE